MTDKTRKLYTIDKALLSQSQKYEWKVNLAHCQYQGLINQKMVAYQNQNVAKVATNKS